MDHAEQQMRFRMPVVFGPSPGPRQGPNGERFDMREAARTTATVSYLTDEKRLARLLPPGCEIDGEPVVTVEHCVLHRLEWLAGRSYSLIGVKFPVRHHGDGGTVRGPFLSVLWENRVEPILTGREELGYPKLYCDLPAARELQGTRHLEASIDGHTFIRMQLTDAAPSDPPSSSKADGVLLHRYLPGLEPGDPPAMNRMVMSPFAASPMRFVGFWRCKGSVAFIRSSWEQLPTSSHIVNALADLPIVEPRGATLAETVGAADLADTRYLDRGGLQE
jgi:hypothetical protein